MCVCMYECIYILQEAVLGVIWNHRAGAVQISSDESFFEEVQVPEFIYTFTVRPPVVSKHFVETFGIKITSHDATNKARNYYCEGKEFIIMCCLLFCYQTNQVLDLCVLPAINDSNHHIVPATSGTLFSNQSLVVYC